MPDQGDAQYDQVEGLENAALFILGPAAKTCPDCRDGPRHAGDAPKKAAQKANDAICPSPAPLNLWRCFYDQPIAAIKNQQDAQTRLGKIHVQIREGVKSHWQPNQAAQDKGP